MTLWMTLWSQDSSLRGRKRILKTSHAKTKKTGLLRKLKTIEDSLVGCIGNCIMLAAVNNSFSFIRVYLFFLQAFETVFL